MAEKIPVELHEYELRTLIGASMGQLADALARTCGKQSPTPTDIRLHLDRLLELSDCLPDPFGKDFKPNIVEKLFHLK